MMTKKVNGVRARDDGGAFWNDVKWRYASSEALRYHMLRFTLVIRVHRRTTKNSIDMCTWARSEKNHIGYSVGYWKVSNWNVVVVATIKGRVGLRGTASIAPFHKDLKAGRIYSRGTKADEEIKAKRRKKNCLKIFAILSTGLLDTC